MTHNEILNASYKTTSSAYYHIKEHLSAVYETCSPEQLDNLIHNVEQLAALFENSDRLARYIVPGLIKN